MAIEFRCTGCQKLLRTADETAGKQAKCPQCGSVVPIPLSSDSSDLPPLEVPPEVAGTWADPASWQTAPKQGQPGASGTQAAGWNPPPPQASAANPYQSPAAGQDWSGAAAHVGRQGPAWERNGPSPRSYIDTIQECLSDMPEFFATMRRDGGIGAPLGFAFVGILMATIANVLFEFLNLGANRFFVNNPALDRNDAMSLAVTAIVVPLGEIVGLFVAAGVYHLFLALFDGARSTFEATFRATAYTTGVTSLLQWIPCVGLQIGLLAGVVLLIVGLANIHETSGWKASGAVLVPLVLCCCVGVGLVSLAIYAAVQQ
jgi:hypothetical protein